MQLQFLGTFYTTANSKYEGWSQMQDVPFVLSVDTKLHQIKSVLMPGLSTTSAVSRNAMKVTICLTNLYLQSADRNGQWFRHPLPQKICQLTNYMDQHFCIV